MQDNNNLNQALEWDAELNDQQERRVLIENDYLYKVVGFERGRFPGSAQMEPSNKAIITLEVNEVAIKCDLILNRKVEWKLTEFFKSIGTEAVDGKVKMDWANIIGKTGMCHVKQRQYVNKNGNQVTINEVSKFYTPEESKDILPF